MVAPSTPQPTATPTGSASPPTQDDTSARPTPAANAAPVASDSGASPVVPSETTTASATTPAAGSVPFTDPAQGLPTSPSGYTVDPQAAQNSPGDKFTVQGGHLRYVPDPALATTDPQYAAGVAQLNTALSTMPATGATAPGVDAATPGFTVVPGTLTDFANQVQTLWDGVLGPSGTASPEGVSGATDQSRGSSAPGVFGSRGEDLGLAQAHDDFRAAAIQLLNEVSVLMGAMPTKAANSARIYTSADQVNAETIYGS